MKVLLTLNRSRLASVTMALGVIRPTWTTAIGAARQRLPPSACPRYHGLPGTKSHAYHLGALVLSRTFTDPPDASLVQTVKEIAALVPEFKRIYIYSHEHQMFGHAVANAEFHAPQHREALNVAGEKLARLVTADVSRRMVQKLFRENRLVSLHSSMRRSIRELFEITAEDRKRTKSIWTSKERENLELMLIHYSHMTERRISRSSRIFKIAVLGLTSGIAYAWWQ